MRAYLLSFVLATAALASPLFGLGDKPPDPIVKIPSGTVVGHLNREGVETFNGIPFAQPPVKGLRLKPPQPLNQSFGTIKSQRNPTACPQFFFQVRSGNLPSNVLGEITKLPITQAITDAGEDCLTINVQRPAGTNSKSKLPVIFYIFGGGFELGSTSQYDGAGFVASSMKHDEPVVWVAVNYRVAGFGFLAGKELAAEGSTNLGLRDQRLGMQWVADNIARFGGDPEKVTIWGESAGSISVYDHLIINGGDNTYKGKPLFRAAIMNSGSAIPVDPVTSPQAQKIYDTVVKYTGCSKESDTLACIREAPYSKVLSAVNSVPGLIGYRSLDLSYLPRPDPGDNFLPESPEVPGLAGKYPKIPLIIGDQEDEGTLFGILTGNITTNEDLVNYLATYFPGNPNAVKAVKGLAANYPDEPEKGQPQGSPYFTGGQYNLYPQYKRLTAILGDIVFNLTRRVLLNYASEKVPTWSYLGTYLRGTSVYGTGHGSDLLFEFRNNTNFVTNSIQAYYLNFIYNMDPNKGYKNETLPEWPNYNTETRQLLDFGNATNGLMPDTFRQEAAEYLQANIKEFRV